MISLITDLSSPPWDRIARWTWRGLDEIGERCEVVHVSDQPPTAEVRETSTVLLGASARRSLGRLTKYLRRTRPVVALVAPANLAPFALTAGRIAGVAVVPWEQAFVERDIVRGPLFAGLLPRLRALTYRWAPMIAATSHDVAVHAAAVAGSDAARTFHLANPVDADEVLAASARTTDDGTHVRICAVGRLSPEKGVDVLIDALTLVDGRLGRPWRLTLVGDGAERAALEQHVQRAGLTSHVHFAGYEANPYPTIASADILVHPARWEGFGLVLTEAMALGVPIVATDCPGGPREILRGGDLGVLARAGDASALADAIVRVANDGQLRSRLSAEGRIAVQRYSPKAIAHRIAELATAVAALRDPSAA